MMLPSTEGRTPNAPLVVYTSGCNRNSKHSNSRPVFFQLVPHSLTFDPSTSCAYEVGEAGGVGAQEESQADQHPARQGTVKRAELVLNPSGQHECQGEHHYGDGECHGGFRPLPAELFYQRVYEHAPGVKSAKGQVHGEPAHYPPPTADAGLFDRLRISCHDCISCYLACGFGCVRLTST